MENVGDVLSLGSPYHLIAVLFHFFAELCLGFGSCHAEIYRGAECQLHAVAVQCRAVFLRFHALGFNFRIVFPKHFQPVRLTDFIACFSQIGKEKFIVMQFPTVIKVIGAYDNVIVKMLAVDMRGDDCFTVAEAFDKLN